ncbi:MAG: GntR family transcriptional regulator, partial [Clostridiaceae bacterium]|nr:GntR family transcriptional regulator [Clostridiaceae bacterium]
MYLPIISDTDKPLFLQLYQAIADDCLSGRLLAGDKLPSRRKLARELRISVNTVDS